MCKSLSNFSESDSFDLVKSIKDVKIKENITLDKAVMIWKDYLLCELAFVLSSNEIFNCSSTVYTYHKPWKIYENIISWFYKEINTDNWFLIIE